MKIVDRSSGWRVFFWISVSKNILKFIAASFFYLFCLFYLKFIYSWLLTEKKKKYLAYLKTMLIYVNYIYIYKRTIKKYKYIVRKSYKHIGSKRPFIGNQDVENSFCKVYMGSL